MFTRNTPDCRCCVTRCVAMASRRWHAAVLIGVVLAATAGCIHDGNKLLGDRGQSAHGAILLHNTTPRTANYEIREEGGTWKRNRLRVDHYHLYRTEEKLECRYGVATDVTVLSPGFLYALRPGPAVSLPPIPLGPAQPCPAIETRSEAVVRNEDLDEPSPGGTSNDSDEQPPPPEEQPAANRADDNTAEENARLRGLLSGYLQQLAEFDPVRLHTRKIGPIQLGTVPLNQRRAEFLVPLSLEHDRTKPVAVWVRAESDSVHCAMRVEPEHLDVKQWDEKSVRLVLGNVPCAGPITGHLILRANSNRLEPDLVIPFAGSVEASLDRPGTSADTVSILSWPSGAKVYLTHLKPGETSDLSRAYLGETPIQMRTPVGKYIFELFPPDPSYDGFWAAPGKAASIASRPGESILAVPFTKREDEAGLVRAMWLPSTGGNVERLARATMNAADLYELGPFEDFENFSVRVLAQFHIALDKATAREFYSALRKTGFFRYVFPEDKPNAAVDIQFHPEADVKFEARFVRLPVLGSRLEPDRKERKQSEQHD